MPAPSSSSTDKPTSSAADPKTDKLTPAQEVKKEAQDNAAVADAKKEAAAEAAASKAKSPEPESKPTEETAEDEGAASEVRPHPASSPSLPMSCGLGT